MIKFPTQVEMVENYLDYCEGVIEIISVDLPEHIVETLVWDAARLNMGIGRYLNKLIIEKCKEVLDG